MDVSIGQQYIHYKRGNCYTVIALGKDSGTLEDVVVYRAEYDDAEFGNSAVWVRPLAEFCGTVEVEGREVPRMTLLTK